MTYREMSTEQSKRENKNAPNLHETKFSVAKNTGQKKSSQSTPYISLQTVM